ncbi:Rap1a/Tai family immunity protein [Massilia sp. GCM10020059]|uniref:Rap1a immunity protein domain-containing protein n=2 Tax=Telluria group TaxID=2895353 RepID=A0ABS8IST2_9BURK|nr:hypothetical protein [Massilia agrisoli]
MMSSRSWIVTAIFFPLSVHAGPYVYPFNAMTGEQVVGKLSKAQSTDIDYIERDMTHSYVNGVKDATQGSIWCFTGSILPHELNIELASSIKATRSARELKKNAAPLLLDELSRRYPCKPGKGGQP